MDGAARILDYARRRNVTKIVIGKTGVRRWKRLLFGSVVDQLLERSGDIDVYVIRGETEATEAAPRHVPYSITCSPVGRPASRLPRSRSCGFRISRGTPIPATTALSP